jgi:hypothetical protein
VPLGTSAFKAGAVVERISQEEEEKRNHKKKKKSHREDGETDCRRCEHRSGRERKKER